MLTNGSLQTDPAVTGHHYAGAMVTPGRNIRANHLQQVLESGCGQSNGGLCYGGHEEFPKNQD